MVRERGSTCWPQQADPLFHQVLLGVSCGVLLLAGLLYVDAEGKVIVPLVERPLPGVCTYQRLLGVGCPGCGLTRCFISLAHGNPAAAWHFNPAGLLLFAVVLAQVPYRGLQLWRIAQVGRELRLGWMSQATFWACFCGLIAQWLWRTFLVS